MCARPPFNGTFANAKSDEFTPCANGGWDVVSRRLVVKPF